VAVGSHPIALTVADLNDDGNMDLLVVNHSSNSVSVLLGNGNGTFKKAVNYAVGSKPRWVSVADFNHDNKLDMVVANSDDNTISVFLGNGDGTFGTPTLYSTGTTDLCVAVGDFNGDGNLDLVTADDKSNTVSVLLGKGDGTFEPRVPYAVGSFPQVVAVADFNGDGKLDLATANQNSNNVTVLQGNGDGTFQAGVNYAVASSPEDVAVGDVNGDGSPDLVTADLNNNNVEVLLNSGPVSLSPTSLTFGTQLLRTTSAPKKVTLTNTGSSALSILSITATAEFSQTNTCGSSVAAGGSCTISVTFAPTAVGKQVGTLTIVDSAGSQSVPLAGTGTAVKLAPGSLNFGTVKVGTSSPAKKVTVTNLGNTALTINSISIGGTNAGDFSQNNTCGNSLAANASCSISVTFTPSATGSRSANVTIVDSDPGSPQKVTLSGTGD